jgi:DNA-binding transcriptional MerR regulator
MEPQRTFTIAEAARRAGVTTHTLRYYEEQGLMLSWVERNGADHRRYSADALGWISFLTKLRETGMPIRRMREYAELVGNGDGNERERLAMLEAHRETVRAQLASLEENVEAIDAKIALYRGALPDGVEAR